MEDAAFGIFIPGGGKGAPPRAVRPFVEAAFDAVGVQDNARRTDRCPGASP
jgi:hypothetical protein